MLHEMKDWIRRHVEAWLVLLAAKILIGRNVHRSKAVSRKDNNSMWYMAEDLEQIAKRMRNKYEGPKA
ncbi:MULTISPECIES: hypothetical protein [Aeromonas]|uniref:Uncharacterized protein n=1 Tax=Aeromonas caviae TaxID=648 RepID=A0AAW9EYF8_AERCA|nr:MULTISPECIES: hypothetical protein [Aeromonas]MBP4058669.1 hypothetical protein [Aeromonas sp. Prich7-2]MDX7720792.1 hypothetical protein [Aeromonas caviae]MDX7811290.1 hypothetical protein [Aeromonas caviae]